nr:hypothetical protein GCM10020093_012470 [Planobispora longispora]
MRGRGGPQSVPDAGRDDRGLDRALPPCRSVSTTSPSSTSRTCTAAWACGSAEPIAPVKASRPGAAVAAPAQYGRRTCAPGEAAAGRRVDVPVGMPTVASSCESVNDQTVVAV